MSWPFVGRTDQLETIQLALRQHEPGAVIATGEPGIGRTSLLEQVLHLMDRQQFLPVVVGGLNPRDRSAELAPALSLPASPEAVARAGREIAAGALGRRAVFLLDDAHIVGQPVVQQLQELHRDADASLVLTHAATSVTPDPLDCLRYVPGAQFIALDPLDRNEVASVLGALVGGRVQPAAADALHAATAGNPGLLHQLMVINGLAGQMILRDGVWQVSPANGPALSLTEPAATRLRSALAQAWSSLSLAPALELAKIAVRAGEADVAAPIWAFTHLVNGRPDEAMRVIDSFDGTAGSSRHSFALTKAVVLAFGLGRVDEAAEQLQRMAAGEPAPMLLAARAWMLATAGRTAAALDALDHLATSGDDGTDVFVHAAAAMILLSGDRPRSAVTHLRRAIVGSGAISAELPWISPYLTGVLADALLLSGRISEATVAAGELHTAQSGTGWDVTVSMSALTGAVISPAASDRDALAT